MQAGVFCFFAGGSGISNSNRHVWQWKEEAMLCEIHVRDFESHFLRVVRDFLAYCQSVCIWRWCVSDVSVFVQQFFNLFAQFKTTKFHESYVFLYPFSNMTISPQNNEKTILYR